MWNVLSMSLLHLALWAESARVLPPANPCPISLCAYCSRSGRMVQHTQISYRRAPAATGLPFVIPAAVGIHAPSFRERTSIAIPSPTAQRNTRNRPHGRSSRPKHFPIPRYGAGIQGRRGRDRVALERLRKPFQHSRLPFVIPAEAGIHAPSFRARTSIAIPSPTAQRNTRNRPHNRSSRPKHFPISRYGAGIQGRRGWTL